VDVKHERMRKAFVRIFKTTPHFAVSCELCQGESVVAHPTNNDPDYHAEFMPFDAELVLAHFAESLSWAVSLPANVAVSVIHKTFPCTCPPQRPASWRCCFISNVGQEAYAYLVFMFDHSVRSQRVIFMQAKPFDHFSLAKHAVREFVSGTDKVVPFVPLGHLVDTDDALGLRLFVPWSKNAASLRLPTYAVAVAFQVLQLLDSVSRHSACTSECDSQLGVARLPRLLTFLAGASFGVSIPTACSGHGGHCVPWPPHHSRRFWAAAAEVVATFPSTPMSEANYRHALADHLHAPFIDAIVRSADAAATTAVTRWRRGGVAAAGPPAVAAGGGGGAAAAGPSATCEPDAARDQNDTNMDKDRAKDKAKANDNDTNGASDTDGVGAAGRTAAPAADSAISVDQPVPSTAARCSAAAAWARGAAACAVAAWVAAAASPSAPLVWASPPTSPRVPRARGRGGPTVPPATPPTPPTPPSAPASAGGGGGPPDGPAVVVDSAVAAATAADGPPVGPLAEGTSATYKLGPLAAAVPAAAARVRGREGLPSESDAKRRKAAAAVAAQSPLSPLAPTAAAPLETAGPASSSSPSSLADGVGPSALADAAAGGGRAADAAAAADAAPADAPADARIVRPSCTPAECHCSVGGPYAAAQGLERLWGWVMGCPLVCRCEALTPSQWVPLCPAAGGAGEGEMESDDVARLEAVLRPVECGCDAFTLWLKARRASAAGDGVTPEPWAAVHDAVAQSICGRLYSRPTP